MLLLYVLSYVDAMLTGINIKNDAIVKELERRGILRSDPRLAPITSILNAMHLERVDRSLSLSLSLSMSLYDKR